MLVQDGGNPRLSDVTTVTVYVNRNLFAPSFAPTQYSRTILDTEAVGVPLVKVTALDADTTVSELFQSVMVILFDILTIFIHGFLSPLVSS